VLAVWAVYKEWRVPAVRVVEPAIAVS
jgi:hypothetical protein